MKNKAQRETYIQWQRIHYKKKGFVFLIFKAVWNTGATEWDFLWELKDIFREIWKGHSVKSTK